MRARSLVALCFALAVATAPAYAQAPIPDPPPEDGILRIGGQDPGTSTRAPLTLPPAGKVWGLNGAQCYFTTFPKDSIRLDPTLNRGLSCPDEAARLRGVGANAVRINVSWYDLEYERDVWNEAAWQHLIATIDALGVPVVATISCTPWWASSISSSRTRGASTCLHSPWDTPEIDAEAEELAEETVRRLGDRVAAVEVYNEPNYKRYWNPAPDPARYGRLFTAASRGAHRADPAATVLFGGGALNKGTDDANGLTIESFFKRAISLGGARPRALDPEAGWDAVSAHIYPPQHDYKVDVPADGTSSYIAGTVREVRRGFRWVDMTSDIWWTETGVTNSGYQVSTSVSGLKVGPGRDWQKPGTPLLKPCGGKHGACNGTVQAAVSEAVAAGALDSILRYLYSVVDTGAVFVHQLVDLGSGYTGGSPEGVSDLSREGRMGLLATPGADGTTVPKAPYCMLQGLALTAPDPAC